MTENELTAPFVVPDGIAEFAREHLIDMSGIAERTGVGLPAVCGWAERHPKLNGLIVVKIGSKKLFWWPQVKALLDELGLPKRNAGEGQKRHPLRTGQRKPTTVPLSSLADRTPFTAVIAGDQVHIREIAAAPGRAVLVTLWDGLAESTTSTRRFPASTPVAFPPEEMS